MLRYFCAILLSIIVTDAFSQCEVKSRQGVDEVMYYYVDYVPFYYTAKKELKGGAITDEQNYFLALKPKPFPPKPGGTKIKNDLYVLLSNDSTYVLEHFDTRYVERDTSLLFMYIIPEDYLPVFRKYEVNQVRIMMGDEGERVYTFKLHKDAVMQQLDCLIGSLQKKKDH
ncbi:MAG: hypothetical protein K1X61_16005 [Chitinophagales bacterium]|nr:hypothetical protein [Chitinophagales bacterium]